MGTEGISLRGVTEQSGQGHPPAGCDKRKRRIGLPMDGCLAGTPASRGGVTSLTGQGDSNTFCRAEGEGTEA